MNKCKRCGVQVLDQTQVCPLCDTVLTTSREKKNEYAEGSSRTYPDVVRKSRRSRKIGRIFLFFAIALEMLLVFINYLTFHSGSKYWSAISGGVLFYIILTMYDVVKRRTGHIRKIYTQMVVVSLLLIFIDYFLDWDGWSLEYGLPCVIFGVVVTIIICMSVNYTNWPNYLLMQIIAVLMSVLDLILFLTGVVHHLVLTYTALGVTILLFVGTLLIGDRRAKNEIKRKFHI